MLPGWNSLDTVSRLHSIFEIAGIAVLALLVVAEVAAYKYGKRKEELLEADSERLRVEIGTAEATAAQARAEAAAAAGRRVSAHQEDVLRRALANGPVGRIWILAHSGDSEGIAFGNDLARVMRSAGWRVDVGNALFFGTRPGIALGVMGPAGTKHVRAQELSKLPRRLVPPGATQLAKALGDAGLAPSFETWEAGEEDFDFKRSPGSFGLTIGHKP